MADDGGKLVVEPCPTLIVGPPGSSWAAGAGAVLVHAVRNRGVLCLVLANAKRSAHIADGAKTKRIVSIDGAGGTRRGAG